MRTLMNRRDALGAIALLAMGQRTASVSTLIGSGTPGYSDREINDPYGLVIGPDGALYFCDLGNQRIRRVDLKTRRTVTIAGSGKRAYEGDGGPATAASLNMPHEIQFDAAGNLYIAERDNHCIRKIAAKTGIISTLAGTGLPGFSGDGGPASQAQLRQPHSIALDPAGGLLICDVGNHRVRRVDLETGRIDTYAGTGERSATPDGAPIKGTPLNGPRTMAFYQRRLVPGASGGQRDRPDCAEDRDHSPRGRHRCVRLCRRRRRGADGEPGGAQRACDWRRQSLCGRHREPRYSPYRAGIGCHHDRARDRAERGRA